MDLMKVRLLLRKLASNGKNEESNSADSWEREIAGRGTLYPEKSQQEMEDHTGKLRWFKGE